MTEKLSLTINLGNAAFMDGGTHEVARILREAAARIEGIPSSEAATWRLKDANGNTCGAVAYDGISTDEEA